MLYTTTLPCLRTLSLTDSQPYLPTPPSRSSSQRSKDGKVIPQSRPSVFGIRRLIRTQIHALCYFLIHALFSAYIRVRVAYHAVKDRVLAILYYHHRTPELIQKDVKGLSRLPNHLSVILKLEDGGRGGLEALVDEVAEIAAWCACVGIPTLSVYERTGGRFLLLFLGSADYHRHTQGICTSHASSGFQETCFIFRRPTPSLDTSRSTRSIHGVH